MKPVTTVVNDAISTVVNNAISTVVNDASPISRSVPPSASMPISTTAQISVRLPSISRQTGGGAFVLLATVGLALKGIWARLAYTEGMQVSAVLFYRSALSAPLVLLSAWWLLRREAKQRRRDGKPPLAFTRRDYVPGMLLGAMFSVGMMCDFEAIAQLGASVSRVVLFGFPLFVMVLEALKHRRLPKPQRLFGFVIAWCGLFAVAQSQDSGPTQFGSNGLSPLGWGLASMTLYAVYVWLSGDLSRKLGSVRLTSASNLTTAAVVVAVLLVYERGSAPAAPQTGLLWIALMVVVSTVIPYFLMMEGIRRMGSESASLLAMTGPVLTVAAGWILLGESLSLTQLAGTVATLAGVAIAQGVKLRRTGHSTTLNDSASD